MTFAMPGSPPTFCTSPWTDVRERRAGDRQELLFAVSPARPRPSSVCGNDEGARNMKLRLMTAAGGLALALGSVSLVPAVAGPGDAAPSLMATAVLKNQQGLVIGQASFQQVGSLVQVRATMAGLEPRSDFHGMHVHTNGVCDGDFTSAGGHWSPSGTTHGDHTGDL